MSQQKKKPIAAGKSSLDHIDQKKAFALLNLQPGDQLVDLACGVGRYSLALADQHPGCKIFAYDLWQEGITTLTHTIEQQKIKNIHPAIANISKPLPLPPGSINRALLATVLHDLPATEQTAVIRHVNEILTENGTINIIEFKKRNDGPGPAMAKRLDIAELEKLFTRQGLKKLHCAELGEYTYMAIFGR